MIDDLDFAELSRWGDPWHGLISGSTLSLPGSVTRSIPGASPVGGDCYAVQIPGQPAVTTSSEDAALGMTWLNYALVAGRNHCVYGSALGADKWIYIDSTGAAWLAALTFNIGTGGGSVAFRRFGIFPDDGVGVVQTATFTATGPFGGAEWQIDDINATGSGALVVTHDPHDVWPGMPAIKTFGYRNVRGGFEISISGVPPAASVSVTTLANQSQASGSAIDTMVRNTTRTYVHSGAYVDTVVSSAGSFGHENRLAGLCYQSGVAAKVLRKFVTTLSSSSSVSPVSGEDKITHTGTGNATHLYELRIGSQSLSLTGSSSWTKSGTVGPGEPLETNYGGAIDYTQTLAGANGYTYSRNVTGDMSVWHDAFEDWIFTDAGDTDNYLVPTSTPNSICAVWPQRLGNGLFALARYTYNPTTYVFGGTNTVGVLHPAGSAATVLSSADPSGRFFGTRHPVTGELSVIVSTGNAGVCYR